MPCKWQDYFCTRGWCHAPGCDGSFKKGQAVPSDSYFPMLEEQTYYRVERTEDYIFLKEDLLRTVGIRAEEGQRVHMMMGENGELIVSVTNKFERPS